MRYNLLIRLQLMVVIMDPRRREFSGMSLMITTWWEIGATPFEDTLMVVAQLHLWAFFQVLLPNSSLPAIFLHLNCQVRRKDLSTFGAEIIFYFIHWGESKEPWKGQAPTQLVCIVSLPLLVFLLHLLSPYHILLSFLRCWEGSFPSSSPSCLQLVSEVPFLSLFSFSAVMISWASCFYFPTYIVELVLFFSWTKIYLFEFIFFLLHILLLSYLC